MPHRSRIPPDVVRPYDDFVHPSSIAEVQAIVRGARAAGAQVRVRGACHSEPGSVLGDGFSRDGRPRPVIDVMLDRLTDIRDGAPSRVIVEAGVSLGGDPYAMGTGNPQGDPELSLFRWLANRRLALPITGGISHQTISGFLSTGSAGGSTQYSFQDAICSLTLVDGKGDVRVVRRGEAHFPALLVSLGLFGILCEIEIEPIPEYGIRGLRSTQRVADADVDLFHDPGTNGRPSLAKFLREKPVSRLMWWPQRGVERVELWEARRVPVPPTTSERIPQSDGVIGPVPQLVARALYAVLFEDVAPGAGESREATTATRLLEAATLVPRGVLLAARLCRDLTWDGSPTCLGRADQYALFEALVALARGKPLLPKPPLDPRGVQVPVSAGAELRELVRDLANLGLDEAIVAAVIRCFIRAHAYAQPGFVDDSGFARRYTADGFFDTWEDGLPMDNPTHDRLLPVLFTESWLPLDRAAEAMRALRDLFALRGLDATGTFTIEVYAAKKSPAWMSAAYDRDVLRIDPFRYEDGDDRGAERFFAEFHETLSAFDARFHWAKALSAPWSTTGVAYRRASLPHFDDFLALRPHYDPDDVFLTRYWAEHLGIVPAVQPA